MAPIPASIKVVSAVIFAGSRGYLDATQVLQSSTHATVNHMFSCLAFRLSTQNDCQPKSG